MPESPEKAQVNECDPGCTRDHAPCTRNRWLDALAGVDTGSCVGFPPIEPCTTGFIDPQAALERRIRALEAEVAALRVVEQERLPSLPEGLDPIVRSLIEERVRRGMSQRAIVRLLECSSATVSNWERGLASPTLNHLREWAAALGFELVLRPGRPEGGGAV